MLIIVIIIVFFALLFLSGAQEEYIYVKKSRKFNEKLSELYHFHLYITNLQEPILTRNYLRNHFFNKEFRLFETTYLREKLGNDLPRIISDFEKFGEKRNLEFSANPKNALWAIKIQNKNRLTNQNLNEFYLVAAFYDNLNKLSTGDQWTLISDEKIEKLKKKGYELECFGSTFNARLPYFGSISELDEPFGRVGSAFDILDKISSGKQIYWKKKKVSVKKITVNPPSGKETLFKTIEAVKNVLEKKKIEIRLNIPLSFDDSFKSYKLQKFIKKRKLLTSAYSFFEKKEINLKNREWVLYVLKNF